MASASKFTKAKVPPLIENAVAKVMNNYFRRKKVCFYLTTRGNYAKTKTIIDNLRGKVELQYIIGGGCPEMEFYGPVRHVTIIKDGSFSGTFKSAGLIAVEAGVILQELMPDILVIVADRFECLPMAMIAHYMGIPIAHLEGGEHSASIDDNIRGAISHLSTLHFPCTVEAERELTEGLRIPENNVHMVGATSFDMLLHASEVMLIKPYLVCIMHTSNVGIEHAKEEIKTVLWALSSLKMETYWIRPNIDTDSAFINSEMNKIKWPFIHMLDSLRIEEYARLLKGAACFVGNSSCGIREAGFLGVPVVNVGDRQAGRERTPNVMDVSCETKAIVEAVKKQVEHGPYEPSTLYGDGHAGRTVAKVLLDYLGIGEVNHVAT